MCGRKQIIAHQLGRVILIGIDPARLSRNRPYVIRTYFLKYVISGFSICKVRLHIGLKHTPSDFTQIRLEGPPSQSRNSRHKNSRITIHNPNAHSEWTSKKLITASHGVRLQAKHSLNIIYARILWVEELFRQTKNEFNIEK